MKPGSDLRARALLPMVPSTILSILMSTILSILMSTILSMCLSSCFLLRKPVSPPPPDPMRNVPRVPMSDEYLRSRTGDIMVFLPKTWFALDAEKDLSSDIGGVAVNPSYTASLVLRTIRSNDVARARLSREGLGGLARYAYDQRVAKAPASLRLLKVVDTVEYAGKLYGYYEFTTDTARTPAFAMRSAVCLSSERMWYEISLIPTMVTAADPPTDEQCTSIFQSVLVTALF
ncbi:MAG: hypothetical protein ACKOAX_06035 [Candidatus Kapaibacterium sp.]